MIGIPKTIENLLHEQIKIEGESSQLYLAISAQCDINGNFYSGKIFRKHADEEREHMLKFHDYMLKRNYLPDTPAFAAQKCPSGCLFEILKAALEHEKFVSSKIRTIVDLCMKEGDYMTMEIGLEMLKEQVEEEDYFNVLVDKAGTIGDKENRDYFIDQFIKFIE